MEPHKFFPRLWVVSSHLPGVLGQGTRFMVIGLIGTFVQTAFFLWAMNLLGSPEKETVLYYVAFGIGFLMEMIPNFFMTAWYIYGVKPTVKSTNCYLVARGMNLVIQFGLLPLMVMWLTTWDNQIISYVVILIAGVVNFLIQRVGFNKKNQ